MAVKISNMSFRYKREAPYIFNDFSLDIDAKHTTIIGETGSGKSTLIELISGIEKVSSGEIQTLDYTLNKKTKFKNLANLRKDCAIVFQSSEDQFSETFVINELLLGPKNLGMDMDQAMRDAKFLIKRIGLEINDLKRNTGYFSGGQKRKIALCSMLMLRPKMIILDEPTIGLDPFSKHDLMDFIFDYVKKHDLDLIIVSHDPDVIFKYSDEVIKLERGEVSFKGSRDEFLTYCYDTKYHDYLPEELVLVDLVNKRFDTNFLNYEEAFAYVKGKSSN